MDLLLARYSHYGQGGARPENDESAGAIESEQDFRENSLLILTGENDPLSSQRSPGIKRESNNAVASLISSVADVHEVSGAANAL